MSSTVVSAQRPMIAKYPGTCRVCGEHFPAETEIVWSRESGAMHVACVPQPSAEDVERAERERAERERAEIAERKERTAQRRASRKAERDARLATPAEHYDGVYDSYNSVPCHRCGGTKYFPYAVYDGKCFYCHAKGYVLSAQVPQPRVRVTAESVETARVGDVLKHGGTLYRVTAIVWRWWNTERFMSAELNQSLKLERLVDGNTRLALKRRVLDAQGRAIVVSDAMRQQPAEQDGDGQWVVC